MATNQDHSMKSNETEQRARSISPRTVWGIVKKILMCLALVLCAALLVITTWLAIDKFILKSKVPSFAGYSLLVVATGSMENTIMEGDLILIKDTGDYKIGDIVTFAHEGEKIPTTHRIVNFDKERGGYKTRGDANNTPDTINVTDDEIYGEVVKVMHEAGLFLGWLTEGGGYIYVFAAILIVGLGVFLIKDESNRNLYLGEGDAAEAEGTDADQISDAQAQGDQAEDTDAKADDT